MSLWRRIAIEKLPELQSKITSADNPYGMWIELRSELNSIYGREPIDDSLIARIYGYAAWCMWQPRNNDLRTAVAVCFYEDLPTDLPIRKDVARWLSVDEFTALRHAFTYHLGEAEVIAFQQEFIARKAELEGYTSRRHRNIIRRVAKSEPSAV